MFDIGPLELLLVFVVALLVIGPERLPSTVKTVSLWISRFRRSFNKIRAEVEKELNADEIRRQIHNESILADVEEAKKKARKFTDDIKSVASREEVEQESDLRLDSTKKGDGAAQGTAPASGTEESDRESAARKASDEESKIARELGQAVSYVNDISREVKSSGEEIRAGLDTEKKNGKPESGKADEKPGAVKSK